MRKERCLKFLKANAVRSVSKKVYVFYHISVLYSYIPVSIIYLLQKCNVKLKVKFSVTVHPHALKPVTLILIKSVSPCVYKDAPALLDKSLTTVNNKCVTTDMCPRRCCKNVV